MTIPSYTASGSFILFIPGLLFLLYGAWQAIRQRQNARRLILWGAVHDAGLICMALGAAAFKTYFSRFRQKIDKKFVYF